VTTEIELAGLELFGHHGVGEEERRRGQRFVFDLHCELRVHPAADRIEDAVDYREIAACVREVFYADQVQLLETLASSVAEALLARFPLAAVRVRVRKPEVRLEPPVEYSAVAVELP
jgi:dihydroneopterin aldolase